MRLYLSVNKQYTFSLVLLACLLILQIATLAQTPSDAVRRNQFNTENGLALSGYDPVAYHKDARAVKGSTQLTATYKGIIYRFASAANRDLFLKNPARYEPAYGGWCAYAMGATGEKVEVDPETFEVRDGRLYLFYHSLFNNTLPKWQKDEPNLQRKADANWQRFITQ
jgi:YHS domain-containing protein